MTSNNTDRPPESPLPAEDTEGDFDERGEVASFPIVGVGASAGGLEAFTQLLKALPPDTGMAFVLVQHLAPTHASALAEILSRATKMTVVEVHAEQRVEPNHVYVIPPARNMIIAGGTLQLLPRDGSTMHRPVDQFFRALAREQGHQAIGVVLSGTASDGTQGLEAIKAEGGITFAQDATALHEGMPRSAVASGCVDFVLPPNEIAWEIVRIGQHPYAAPPPGSREQDREPSFAQVVHLVHRATGIDFAHYKYNTLYRRITRRMVLQKLDGLNKYVEFLRRTPAEVDALHQDILISVTSFFRDPESFEALKSKVFPALLKDRDHHDPLRVWTLGCSTGQEAYSLAMAFAEAADATGSNVPLQLFATDLNPAGIEKARAGLYSKDIGQDVSPERLRRFFAEVDGSYRIAKSIRDACVFSRHNVLADPPFSHIDLISCRNLLIYLEPILQQKIVPTLHYALKPSGFLFLGGSETIGSYRNLFDTRDAKHKIYAKNPGSGPGYTHFPLPQGGARRGPFVPIAARPSDSADLPREADRILLTKFAPPGVLVSADLDILQYRGDTGAYLAPAPGKASLNLLKMLREGLLVAVRAAVLRAGKEEVPVREEGLRVKSNGGYRQVAIEVMPVKASGGSKGGFLILFEGAAPAEGGCLHDASPDKPNDASHFSHAETDNARLAQELSATREYLQSIVEQQEAANEELQSANEEVQSANEELQSTNEELETSKEEIQSSNEELAIVNDELNNRNGELHRLNNDLVNLLASVQMPIIILGPDLRIRRFTPAAENLLNLVPADVGRQLGEFKFSLDLPDLQPLLNEVLDTVSIKEVEVRDKHEHWYSLRLRPYKTLDNKIDGVVVMLVDVDAMKRAHDRIRESEAQYRAMFEATSVGVCEADPETGRLLRVNEQFARIIGYTAAEVIGKPFLELTHPGDLSGNWEAYSRLVRGETAFYEIENRLVHKDGTIVLAHLTVNLVRDAAGRPLRTVAIAIDITEHNRAEGLIQEQRRILELIAKGETAQYCLEELCLGIERIDPKVRACVLLANEERTFFSSIIAPRFPGLAEAIRNVPVGDGWSGTCAQVVVSGKPVICGDVANDTRWMADWKSLCLAHGIRAGYSSPLFETDEPVGSVFLCFDVPKEPTESDLRLADMATDLARILLRREQARQEVRESAHRLQFVMDSAPQKLFTARPNGDVDYFNPIWMDFTGLSFEQIKDWGWKQFMHPDDLAETVRVWRHSIETGEPFQVEHRFRRADGEYRWHLSRAQAMRDPEGKVVMWVGSNTDIHEQKQTANQLLQYTADLSESDRRKNEFLAMLAHELRNPLAPIRNALHVLRLTGGNGEAVQSASAMMERQVGQMVRLVDDLLDVSRISRGKIELRRVRVELASIVQHAVEASRPAIETAGLVLSVTLPLDPVYLNADPTRVAQVVGNLLNNACKFTDKGGRISLTADRNGEEAVIRVRDTGIGIAADQLPRIFDMFVQIDTSLERSVSGLGIGLTLVKSLVDMHGGTVEVYSAGLGKGSEFVVRLPIAVDTTRPPPEPVATAPTRTNARRILVVDDNQDSAKSLAMLLKLTGNDTYTAYDGLEAVEAAAKFRPDVILLDIGLPKLNGYDACRRIREQPWGKAMLLVALTGWGQDQDRQKSTQAGFNGHLVKPVGHATIMRLLADLDQTPV